MAKTATSFASKLEKVRKEYAGEGLSSWDDSTWMSPIPKMMPDIKTHSPGLRKLLALDFIRQRMDDDEKRLLNEAHVSNIELVKEDFDYMQERREQMQFYIFEHWLEQQNAEKCVEHPMYHKWLKDRWPNIYTAREKVMKHAEKCAKRFLELLIDGIKGFDDILFIYMLYHDHLTSRYIDTYFLPLKSDADQKKFRAKKTEQMELGMTPEELLKQQRQAMFNKFLVLDRCNNLSIWNQYNAISCNPRNAKRGPFEWSKLREDAEVKIGWRGEVALAPAV